MTTRVVTDEQLGVLGRRQNDLFRRVREGSLPVEDVLKGLQSLIEGDFDAIPAGLRRFIDCDTSPLIPEGWEIRPEDQLPGAVGGQIEFDSAKILLHLDESQRSGSMVGTELAKKLSGKPLLKANVLDHLLANTNLIPEAWKTDDQGRTRHIPLWGTIYRDAGGHLCVRYLYWHVGQWDWFFSWLGHDFYGQDPAAILAS